MSLPLFGIGWTETMVLVAIPGLTALICAIDAAIKPDSAWKGADQSKLVWVLLLMVGVVLPFLGLIPSMIYLLRVRRAVVAASKRSG